MDLVKYWKDSNFVNIKMSHGLKFDGYLHDCLSLKQVSCEAAKTLPKTRCNRTVNTEWLLPYSKPFILQEKEMVIMKCLTSVCQ